MKTGIAGEIRAVVTGADGAVRIDTGFQRNKILNQGLDQIAVGDVHNNVLSNCLVGAGTSAPTNTQTLLDSFIAKNTTTASYVSDYSYTDVGDNLYKTNITVAFRFTGLGDVNISEVGLASRFTSGTVYTLCTRALIKDALGAPTTISVNTGETLDIYYRMWQVFSTLDISGVVNMLDGAGGSVPYNTTARLYAVGSYNGRWDQVVTKLRHITGGSTAAEEARTQERDLVPFTTDMGTAPKKSLTSVFGEYVPGTYKQTLTLTASLTQANDTVIRTLSVPTTRGTWQIRYGSVTGDNPIPKTNKDTLSIPLEFSWGRYEGAL